jgi:hypothetical protein
MSGKGTSLWTVGVVSAVCAGLAFAAGVAWERTHQPIYMDGGWLRIDGPQAFQLVSESAAVRLSATPEMSMVEATRDVRRAALEADAEGARLVLSDASANRIEVGLTDDTAQLHATTSTHQVLLSIPTDAEPPVLTFDTTAGGGTQQRCVLGPTEFVCNGLPASGVPSTTDGNDRR